MTKKYLIWGVLFFLVYSFSQNAEAQEKAKYQDRDVVANSVIIKIDDSSKKINGQTFSAEKLNQKLSTQYSAELKSELKAGNIQEWKVQGNLEEIIADLNRMPGVTAFPNYIFKREEFNPEPLDLSDSHQITSEKNGTDKVKPASSSINTIFLEDLDSEPLSRIFEDDFDDETAVNGNWAVADYAESGVVWELGDDNAGGLQFEVKNTSGAPAVVSADLVSPTLDLTTLDPNKSYRVRFDIENSYVPGTFIGIFAESESLDEDVEISNYDEWGWWEITQFVGENLTLFFYVENENVADGEHLVSIDNVVIEEYPVNDTFIESQYALHNDGLFSSNSVAGADISAFEAWETTTGSDEAVIVVFDDGVDYDHLDLANNAWVNPCEDINDDGFITEDDVNGVDDCGNGYADDFFGWSPIYGNNSYMNPGSFHGTHVAGIIGAEGGNGIGVAGVAHDVSLISVMIFNEYGTTTSLAIMKGYDYISQLLDAGVNITAVNQSWGGGNLIGYQSDERYVEVMTNYALDHAEHDVLWVVSAGNSGTNRDNLDYYSTPNNIQSPNIITVANTNDAEQISASSDFGIRTVHIGAPGSSIASTYPGNSYVYMSGTSMAAPHVSGALALAKAAYPDEDSFALLSRILAGADITGTYDGIFGEGGRLNAHAAINPAEAGITDELIASHNTAYFHKTYVDKNGFRTIGFINNSGSAVTVSGILISGTNSDAFALGNDFTSVEVADGAAFGFPIAFISSNNYDELIATATIETSGGNVDINLNAKEQGFPSIVVNPEFDNVGTVALGETVESTFQVTNEGTADLHFGINQVLYSFSDELYADIQEQVTFKASPNRQPDKVKPDQEELLNQITAQVFANREEGERQKIKYEKGSHSKLESGAEVLFDDDLNDPEVTLAQWDLQAFGFGAGALETFKLVDIGDGETDNVFLAGDFAEGYENNTVAVAIPPSFDFSELDNQDPVKAPFYLTFDYSADLENGWDYFYVNVIVNGERLETLDITDIGSLIADGGAYTAFLDITHLAGYDNVEFWFIMASDGVFVEGFGALFDNVQVIADEAPYFTTTRNSTVSPGDSEDITVSARTDLLGTGDFLLTTYIGTNDPNKYLYGDAYHDMYFESRYVNLSFEEPYTEAGEIPQDSKLEYSLNVVNKGAVDANYRAQVFLGGYSYYDSYSAKMKKVASTAAKAPATDKAESSHNFRANKQYLESLDPPELKPASVKKAPTLKKPTSAFSGALLSSQEIYTENFESGELSEEWDVTDDSYGLGHVFGVEFLDCECENVLGVGDFDDLYIYDNTRTVAYSPYFSLEDVPDSEVIYLEFEYSLLLESGYDFADVFVGYRNSEGGFHYFYLGSSEDLLENNGEVNWASFNIDFLKGESEVFLTFLVYTDAGVQSNWAYFDNLMVYTNEKLAYASPEFGKIDSGASQQLNVTVNAQELSPGSYYAMTYLEYEDGEYYEYGESYQETSFNIENDVPVANDDVLAVVSGDVIGVDQIIDALLANDEDNNYLYIEEATDPMYGSFRYLSFENEDVEAEYYVAPPNFEGEDTFQYRVSDGMDYDEATVTIQVFAEPGFVKGNDQQYVFLEDEELTISTLMLAAGVGGYDDDLYVWGESGDSNVQITHNSDDNSITFTANEDYFGQSTAELFVGKNDDPLDAMEISIVVVPVNDAPTAKFASEINNGVYHFSDQSSDPKDLSDGGIVAWEWDFGDGNTSEDKNPQHTYRESDTYLVTLTVTDNGGLTATTQSELNVTVSNEPGSGIPDKFAISQNYPNPFNPSTQINFDLPYASQVVLEVYNMVGQKVATLANGRFNAGSHKVSFDAARLSSGMYIYRLKAGSFIQTKKMTLIK